MLLHRALGATAAALAVLAAWSCDTTEPRPSPPTAQQTPVLYATAAPARSPVANGAPPDAGPAGPVSNGVPAPEVSGRAVLVVDERSWTPLFERAARERRAPASLTKIATAVVVLESGLPLDRVLEVHPDLDRHWLEDSAVMGLLPGDRFSVRELLQGLLMVSGADAATELAGAVSGTEEAFVERMNALANRLGLRDTRFTDVHGLGAERQYSTAWDLALLGRHAMTFPVFREIVGTETHAATGTRELPLYNHNPLLNYTPGVDGIKTGFTEEAGRTFVASAERDAHRIIVVLLDAPMMPFDAIALIDWAFANHTWR